MSQESVLKFFKKNPGKEFPATEIMKKLELGNSSIRNSLNKLFHQGDVKRRLAKFPDCNKQHHLYKLNKGGKK